MARIIIVSLASALCLAYGSAQADDAADETGVTFNVGIGVLSTDNALSSSTNPVSDVIISETLGAAVKAGYSQQTFGLDANIKANHYQTNTSLNYIENSAKANWNWNLGRNWHGMVIAGQVVALSPPANNQDPSQRNVNTTQNSEIGAGYSVGGGWQATTGVVSVRSTNEHPLIGQTDFQYSGGYIGTFYAFPSGSTLAINFQSANGSNLYNYSTQSAEIKLNVNNNENLTLAGRLAYMSQTYDGFSKFNFSGLSASALTKWVITGKTTLGFSIEHQLNPNPAIDSIYSVTDTYALTPVWQMTQRFSLKGLFQTSNMDFQGNPGGGASDRQDVIKSRSVGLDWLLRERAIIGLSVAQSRRSSNAPNVDFVENQVRVLGTYSF